MPDELRPEVMTLEHAIDLMNAAIAREQETYRINVSLVEENKVLRNQLCQCGANTDCGL